MSGLQGQRILVTGGPGFIGSHLTRRLVGLGADVAVLTKYNSIIDNVRIADLWDRVHIIEADLRNLDSLLQIRAFAPRLVFHLAAYNHVGDSFVHVSEAMDVNSKGTANLVQALDGFDRLVYVSTSEVYGSQRKVPFVESMTPRPVSPYSVGKYAGELYCRMLMEEMGKPVAIVRPFNAFGPYQSVRAVVAELILTCLDGRPVHATAGVQTREFNFVENLVDGILMAGTAPSAIGRTVNLGTGEEIAIHDLVTTIHRETGSASELHIGSLPYRPTEIWRMAADNQSAKETLGWQPRVPFIDGLRTTIDWFRAFREEFRSPGKGLQRLAAWLD
jgi:UDP-glucose 4-epimerase